MHELEDARAGTGGCTGGKQSVGGRSRVATGEDLTSGPHPAPRLLPGGAAGVMGGSAARVDGRVASR